MAPFIQELFPDSGGYLRCVRDFKDNLNFDEIGCQASITAESESFQFLISKEVLQQFIIQYSLFLL